MDRFYSEMIACGDRNPFGQLTRLEISDLLASDLLVWEPW